MKGKKTSPAKAPSQSKARPAGVSSGSKRLTIAVLLDNANFFGGGYEAQLREALDAKCREDGHNLLLVYGGPLNDPNPMAAAGNVIYRTLRPDSCDGIIIVASVLAAYCGAETVARLIDHYRPSSLCSIGIAFPGIPSLILDNRCGMEDAVEHLIREHGVRRPVFLAGTPMNPEAQSRFDAFEAVLDRNGLPFDPDLVICGNFMPNQGRAAMDELLARGIPFDAVVAANDSMAVGAIDALRKWSRRVPRDVPVTGFDDLLMARLGNPPLTTVAQPLEQMANLAVETVVAQAAGKKVPECVVLPSRFVRRRSCGCEFEQNPKSTPGPLPRRSAKHPNPGERIEALRPILPGLLRAHPEDATQVSQRLIDGLHLALSGQYRAFAKTVGDLLEDVGDDSERLEMLQDAIGRLRDELADVLDIELERAFFEGLNLVAFCSTTTRTRQRLTLDDTYSRLLTVGVQASVTFDLASLKSTLIKGLPATGVRTAFLSRALDVTATDLEPVACVLDGNPIEIPETRFPASKLLPTSALQIEPRRTFLVLPMASESQLLGVAAFDYADGINAYAVFRNEITSVLNSIRLHEELVEQTMLRERSVQERLSTTKRMEALSLLAGGVAHDLNNALGPLVALPDVILKELGNLAGGRTGVRDIRRDVENIRSAALRAAQTIKDLLTLGRQGRTVRENIDFGRVVRICLADSSLSLGSDKSRHVDIDVTRTPEPLSIRGSESQLSRAVGNLLRNAAEAIEGDGKITVKTWCEELTAPAGRYENIPPGTYAVLSVSDSGCGIPEQDLAHIFEPFFTKKRTRENSGTGLGLAIVHGVVKEHEGYIDVTSAPGAGTTFTLYLPISKSNGEEESKPAVLPVVQAARILVVDDEPMQLRTCRRVLVHLGYQVETMQSGLRTCEIFSQAAETGESPFDLVIIDMVLGEMLDGLQVIEVIQRLFPTQKAIVVSGHAPNERAELAMKKGLPWLAKPYSIEALSRAVERTLHGEDDS